MHTFHAGMVTDLMLRKFCNVSKTYFIAKLPYALLLLMTETDRRTGKTK